MTPYRLGGATWAGADCWGLTLLWFRHARGVELPGHRVFYRAGGARDSIGTNIETAGRHGLVPLPLPAGGPEAVPDGSIVLMKGGAGEIGHCGVLIAGRVLHTEKHTGALYQPVLTPMLRHRICAYADVG